MGGLTVFMSTPSWRLVIIRSTPASKYVHLPANDGQRPCDLSDTTFHSLCISSNTKTYVAARSSLLGDWGIATGIVAP